MVLTVGRYVSPSSQTTNASIFPLTEQIITRTLFQRSVSKNKNWSVQRPFIVALFIIGNDWNYPKVPKRELSESIPGSTDRVKYDIPVESRDQGLHCSGGDVQDISSDKNLSAGQCVEFLPYTQEGYGGVCVYTSMCMILLVFSKEI